MSRRNLISMNDEEIRAFLQQQRTLQVATIDHDGWPHVVAMWFVLKDDKLVFWTYAKSQKAVNLRRDPRLTCLVEAGWIITNCGACRSRDEQSSTTTAKPSSASARPSTNATLVAS